MDSAATPTKPKRSRAKKVEDNLSPEAWADVKATMAHETAQGDLAATQEKPRRYKKVDVEAAKAAATTHRERMAAVDARAAETRKRVAAEYAEKGYGPMPRTGIRWMGRRTKGLPYSRMTVEKVVPGMNGLPGLIYAKHPTRKTGLKKLVATPAILETFMPSLPGSLTAAMLGVN